MLDGALERAPLLAALLGAHSHPRSGKSRSFAAIPLGLLFQHRHEIPELSKLIDLYLSIGFTHGFTPNHIYLVLLQSASATSAAGGGGSPASSSAPAAAPSNCGPPLEIVYEDPKEDSLSLLSAGTAVAAPPQGLILQGRAMTLARQNLTLKLN